MSSDGLRDAIELVLERWQYTTPTNVADHVVDAVRGYLTEHYDGDDPFFSALQRTVDVGLSDDEEHTHHLSGPYYDNPTSSTRWDKPGVRRCLDCGVVVTDD